MKGTNLQQYMCINAKETGFINKQVCQSAVAVCDFAKKYTQLNIFYFYFLWGFKYDSTRVDKSPLWDRIKLLLIATSY